MSRPLALALLVVGVILLALGINASESFSSETSEVLTGAPTNKALWMMIGGGAAALIGLFGLLGRRRTV